MSPTKDGTAAGRQLDRLGGDGGYMVIAHTDRHDELRSRIESLGIRTVLEAEDDGYRIMQLHPSDTGGSFLEIDFQPGGEDPAGPWMPAGPDWQRAVRTDVVDGFTGVELAVPEPDQVAAHWTEILGQPQFDNASITYTEGTGGLVAVDLRGRGSGTHRVGGVDFRL